MAFTFLTSPSIGDSIYANGIRYYYNGIAWETAVKNVSGSRRTKTFISPPNQVTYLCPFSVDNSEVFINGIKISDSDYIVDGGGLITLNVAPTAGSEVEVIGYGSFDIASMVDGMGLSQESYTTVEKTKLAGIETGAQVNTVTSVAGKTGVVTLTSSDVGLGNVSNTAQVTSVTGTAPIVSSGGTTPAISISAATTSAAGSMSATDKTKLDGISGTNTGDETAATIKTKLGISTLSGSNTGDQTITLTGDVTGSGTGSFAATLANSGVTAGTYTKVTTDAKGRVTAGTTLIASDIPTLNQNTTGSSGSCTGNAATATTATNLSGGTVSATTGTFSGAVSVLSLTETSDRNFKDNIETLGTGLIESIRPVSFTWKDGGKKAYGVIAQELEEVLPEAVLTSEEGVKSVQYTQLIPLLIAEVQALRNEINILKGVK